mmetsp:Transcript_34352/g.65636  ORF Transcript_34352/g.65636 Transcript_34352/m.65636 type:complete len:216 (+) Transcript_34352:850-1497(+)
MYGSSIIVMVTPPITGSVGMSERSTTRKLPFICKSDTWTFKVCFAVSAPSTPSTISGSAFHLKPMSITRSSSMVVGFISGVTRKCLISGGTGPKLNTGMVMASSPLTSAIASRIKGDTISTIASPPMELRCGHNTLTIWLSHRTRSSGTKRRPLSSSCTQSWSSFSTAGRMASFTQDRLMISSRRWTSSRLRLRNACTAAARCTRSLRRRRALVK